MTKYLKSEPFSIGGTKAPQWPKCPVQDCKHPDGWSHKGPCVFENKEKPS